MTNKKRQASSLVLEKMMQEGLSRSEVVRRLGYRNANKGIRRLDLFLKGEGTDSELVPKLITALDLDADSMHEAIDEDRLRDRQLAEDYARERFNPNIYIQTYATRPSQICIFAMTGGTRVHKTVDVTEEIIAKPWHEQVKVVGSLVRKHYQASDGLAPFFGAISGYLYCPTFDNSYEFTIEGESDGTDKGIFWRPEATIRVK